MTLDFDALTWLVGMVLLAAVLIVLRHQGRSFSYLSLSSARLEGDNLSCTASRRHECGGDEGASNFYFVSRKHYPV